MASRRLIPDLNKAIPVERRTRGTALAPGILLVAATFTAHFPAIFAGYIWDDDLALCNNPLINGDSGPTGIWFTTGTPDYWPLTSTMFWVEWRLWGNNPKPYHVGNIFLHAVAAVLLWRVLRRLGTDEPCACLAGLIFAVHPATVESVAWIAERKNVLSIGLYLLAILVYLRFEETGGRRWYAFALLAAVAALLAKTSVAMLPLVLLLCVWWKRGGLTRRDLLRTAPFFALSLAAGLATIWFQHHNAIAGQVVRSENLASKIASAGWIVWFYLYKIILPIRLIMIYPRWNVDGGRIISFVPLALLIGCLIVSWRHRATWGRGPFAALAYFVIVLAPVLGFVNMSFMRYSLVSDHLQYAAMPGVIALIAGCITTLAFRAKAYWPRAGRLVSAVIIGAVLLILTGLTWRQASTFKNPRALWEHTLRYNDRAWVAWASLSVVCSEQGQFEQAVRDSTRALEIKPDCAEAYYNRGNAFRNEGLHDPAIQDYTRAIRLSPDYAEAYYNRALTYSNLGRFDLAGQDYTRAIELQPNMADAYVNRGNAYGVRGEFNLAIRDYDQAILLQPNDASAYYNRGLANKNTGQFDAAIRDFTKAIALQSNSADTYRNRGEAYFSLKQYDRAWSDVKTCRRLGGTPPPDLIQALTEATGRTE